MSSFWLEVCSKKKSSLSLFLSFYLRLAAGLEMVNVVVVVALLLLLGESWGQSSKSDLYSRPSNNLDHKIKVVDLAKL